MKRRGVKPETVRLELSDGDWVDIKRVLTVGEESDIAFKAMKTIRTADSAAEIDGALMRFLMAATYVQGWSLLDYDGQPIKWPVSKPLDDRVAVLRALDRESMEELEAAIAAHRESLEKNAPSGETAPAAASPSAA